MKDGDTGAVYLWAGDSVRIALCRLCSNMALGTIISHRIKENMRDFFEEAQKGNDG